MCCTRLPVAHFPSPRTQVAKRAEDKEKKAADAAARASDEGRRTYWAKGTGYGHDGAGSTSLDIAAQKRKESRREHLTTSLFEVVLAFLKPLAGALTVPHDLNTRLSSSCLVPVLSSYLRSTEVRDSRPVILPRLAWHCCDAI